MELKAVDDHWNALSDSVDGAVELNIEELFGELCFFIHSNYTKSQASELATVSPDTAGGKAAKWVAQNFDDLQNNNFWDVYEYNEEMNQD